MEISIRQGAGNYWSAGSFSSGSEVWNTTTLAGGNWSYTFPASSFPADGTYTIRVRATDNVNLVETPSSRSFTIDRVAPDTTIDSNPSNPSTSANASFSFSSTEGSSTFECQIDGGGYSSCTSPKSYSSLSEGSHTFLVRATDVAGNTDGSAASYTWTVDTVAPSSTTSFPASAGTYNTSGWNAGCGTIGFCGTYSDATIGRAEGGDLHPPGRGQLLERHLVRQRQRGLDHDRVARRRQLVVRLPGVELPRGRLLHDPRQGNGQRDER